MTDVICQVYRLEKHDTDRNEFKHYTGIVSHADHCLFGYSRIGARYQWTGPSSRTASARQILVRKLNTKRSSGYDDTWSGEITVPSAWLENSGFRDRLQSAIETARMEGRTSFGTDVDEEPKTILSDVVVKCRGLVTKMAVDPDAAVVEYASLVADAESIRDDMSTVDSYIDTLRVMLAGAGKGT